MATADRWLCPADGAKLLALLPELSEEGRDLVERRCIAPWQRRASKRQRLISAARALAEMFPGTSGRAIGRAIERALVRPDSVSKDRRTLVHEFLRLNGGRPLKAQTISKMLGHVVGTIQDVTIPIERRMTDGRSEEGSSDVEFAETPRAPRRQHG